MSVCHPLQDEVCLRGDPTPVIQSHKVILIQSSGLENVLPPIVFDFKSDYFQPNEPEDQF